MAARRDTAKMRRAAARPFETLYSDALAGEIVRRVLGGESLAAVYRDAHMPTATTVGNWARADREFAIALRWAKSQARLAQRRRLIARRQARGTRPKKRNCPGSVSGYTPERAEAICAALTEGLSLQAVCRQVAAAPSVGTVYNWLQAFPEFARAYGVAREVQQMMLCDQAFELALGALGPEDFAALSRARAHASHLLPRVWGDEEGLDL